MKRQRLHRNSRPEDDKDISSIFHKTASGGMELWRMSREDDRRDKRQRRRRDKHRPLFK